MTTNYCPNCGMKASVANGVAPNFCGKCGQSLKTITRTVAPNPVTPDEDISVAGEENIDVGSLAEKIKITIDMPQERKITVGDVIAAAKSSGITQEQRLPPRPPDKSLPKGKKQLFKAIQESCSSSRNAPLEIGGDGGGSEKDSE